MIHLDADQPLHIHQFQVGWMLHPGRITGQGELHAELDFLLLFSIVLIKLRGDRHFGFVWFSEMMGFSQVDTPFSVSTSDLEVYFQFWFFGKVG